MELSKRLSHPFTSLFSIVGKRLNALDVLQVVKLGETLSDNLLVCLLSLHLLDGEEHMSSRAYESLHTKFQKFSNTELSLKAQVHCKWSLLVV